MQPGSGRPGLRGSLRTVSKSVSKPDGIQGYGLGLGGMVKTLRRFVENPRAVDSVVVVLSTWLVLGAYIEAYAYVHLPGETVQWAATVGITIVTAAWALITVFLFVAWSFGLSAGRAWNKALPDGHTGTLAATFVFGGAWIVDEAFWSLAFGRGGLGLEQLFTPPHLVEMAAAVVIVSGALRAAARRGETIATPITLASTALLLASLTFATQFINPLIDPWAAADFEFRLPESESWLAENVGVASILLQAAILAGTALLLNSAFKLRPGSITFVFAIDGLLATITKGRFYLLPVPIVTGIAADAWVAWTARRPGKPSASLCAVIGTVFAASYLAEIALVGAGTKWPPSLLFGTVIGAGMLTWLMGRLLRAGLPAAVIMPYLSEHPEEPVAEQWTLDPDRSVREQIVRAALDDLGTPEALARSPLAKLRGVGENGSTAVELRAMLIDVIGEVVASTSPRDAEAGRLLLDYYVKRVGSHDVIMERLHLSRPTYYRRLHHGFELVADRLDEMLVIRA